MEAHMYGKCVCGDYYLTNICPCSSFTKPLDSIQPPRYYGEEELCDCWQVHENVGGIDGCQHECHAPPKPEGVWKKCRASECPNFQSDLCLVHSKPYSLSPQPPTEKHYGHPSGGECGYCSPHHKPTSWVERFDAIYPSVVFSPDRVKYEALKDFIRAEISSAEARARREERETITHDFAELYNFVESLDVREHGEDIEMKWKIVRALRAFFRSLQSPNPTPDIT